MTEILFQAKRLDNGEWVEGHNILLVDNQTKAFVVPTGSIVSLVDNIKAGGHLYPEAIVIPRIEVDVKSIRQFTGMLDKNGTKIFSGDVVDYDGEYGKIYYDEGCAYYELSCDTWCTNFDSIYDYELEVIGNIYDHPELLGVSK